MKDICCKQNEGHMNGMKEKSKERTFWERVSSTWIYQDPHRYGDETILVILKHFLLFSIFNWCFWMEERKDGEWICVFKELIWVQADKYYGLTLISVLSLKCHFMQPGLFPAQLGLITMKAVPSKSLQFGSIHPNLIMGSQWVKLLLPAKWGLNLSSVFLLGSLFHVTRVMLVFIMVLNLNRSHLFNITR